MNLHPVLVIIATQVLFTVGDLLARANLRADGFTLAAFLKWWFLVYFIIRQIATVGQLFVFASVQLGKTMAMFGAVSIILANGMSVLLLKEVLTPGTYLGVGLAVCAFIVLALR